MAGEVAGSKVAAAVDWPVASRSVPTSAVVPPPGAVIVKLAASPSPSPPSPAPRSVTWMPSLRSPLASTPGVMLVPGVGSVIAHAGATVSTNTEVTPDDREVTPSATPHSARRLIWPSGALVARLTVPASPMVPAATSVSGTPGADRNSLTCSPGRAVMIVSPWKPAIAASASASAFHTSSGA